MSLFVSSVKPAPLRGKESSGVRNHAARVDHTHSSLGVEQVLFSILGANMNVTTDQKLMQAWDFGDYLITEIRVAGASLSLTTAKGGLYTAAAKGGVAVVAATQAYADLTTAAKGLVLTLTADGKAKLDGTDGLFFALTTIQGAASTADVFVMGIPLSEAAA